MINSNCSDPIVSDDCYTQVAPRGVADRVILGLIPSSEGSWGSGCACIRPDRGGWLHIHGNVTAGVKSSGEREREEMMDRERLINDYDHVGGAQSSVEECCTASFALLERSAREWSGYVRTKITGILNRLYCPHLDSFPDRPCNGNGAGGWSVSVRHIECVKSYAPHVHHVVVDLECRPSKI